MTGAWHKHTVIKVKKGKPTYPGRGSSSDPLLWWPWESGENADSSWAPLQTTKLAVFTNLSLNVMRSKRSVTSDLYPKSMLKITDQVVIRKARAVIQSLQSHHHSIYSQDHEKASLFHPCPRKIKVVNNVGPIELLGIDVSCHHIDITSKCMDPPAVKEGVLGCSIDTTVTIGHFCRAHFKGHAGKGQCLPDKVSGRWTLRVSQITRFWDPSPLGANLLQRQAKLPL